MLLVDIIGMLVHNAIEAGLEASFETKIELLCLFLHCKKKSCMLMEGAGLQWHPGNRPVVEFNGHNVSLVN